MNAHDVRRLSVCCFCKSLDTDLLKLDEARKSRHAHARCLVEKKGFAALASLPIEEHGKVTLDDMLAMGIRTLDEYNERLRQPHAERLRKAAIAFGKNIGVEPTDMDDKHGARLNRALLNAAEAYTFSGDFEERVYKALLDEDSWIEAPETDEDKRRLAGRIANFLRK